MLLPNLVAKIEYFGYLTNEFLAGVEAFLWQQWLSLRMLKPFYCSNVSHCKLVGIFMAMT